MGKFPDLTALVEQVNKSRILAPNLKEMTLHVFSNTKTPNLIARYVACNAARLVAIPCLRLFLATVPRAALSRCGDVVYALFLWSMTASPLCLLALQRSRAEPLACPTVDEPRRHHFPPRDAVHSRHF